MPRKPKGGSVDMTELINFIKVYIREQQRDNPKYTRAALARQCGIGGSTLSELVNHPDREPSGRTLGALAEGMGVDPAKLYRIAYPRSSDEALRGRRRQETVKVPPHITAAIEGDPQFYNRLVELAERISPERRARVLAFTEGLAEAKSHLKQ